MHELLKSHNVSEEQRTAPERSKLIYLTSEDLWQGSRRHCTKQIVSSECCTYIFTGLLAFLLACNSCSGKDHDSHCQVSLSQVAGNFLQEILELSVRDSLEGLSKAALEVLVIVTLFPTGAPILSCIVEVVWQSCCTEPSSNIWVSLNLWK